VEGCWGVFWFALGNFRDFIEEAAVTSRIVEGGVEGLDGNGVWIRIVLVS
jgi:hypothetical protein